MLTKTRTLLAAVLLVATAAAAQAPEKTAAAAAQASEKAAGPTLDQIVAKHLEAMGGRDKITALKSLRMTGKMMMGQGMESSFVMEQARPNALRVEFNFQGMTGVQAFDGTAGWSIMPFAGKTDPEPMSEQDLSEMRERADLDGPLLDYKAKGTEVELIGKETVEGTEVYNLKITPKGGDVRHMFLDAEYFLPIKETARRMVQDNEMEVQVSLGDYKEVGGLKFPHSIETKVSGVPMTQTLVISKIEVNPEIDPSRFEMPAAKTTEPAKPEAAAQPEPGKAEPRAAEPAKPGKAEPKKKKEEKDRR